MYQIPFHLVAQAQPRKTQFRDGAFRKRTHNDNRNITPRRIGVQGFQYGSAIHDRHHKIKQYKVRPPFPQPLQALPAVYCSNHFMACVGQRGFEQFSDAVLVVDDQDQSHVIPRRHARDPKVVKLVRPPPRWFAPISPLRRDSHLLR